LGCLNASVSAPPGKGQGMPFPGQTHLDFSASKFPLNWQALKKKITAKSNKSKKEEKTRLCTGTYSASRLKFFQNLAVSRTMKVK
jgi:hypothetical protein